MDGLETIYIEDWENQISQDIQNKAVTALEAGKVVYFPTLAFPIRSKEQLLFSPEKVDPKSKNISYDLRNDRLSGTSSVGEEAELLKEMIRRYATTCRKFVDKLIPIYTRGLVQARTSFRPVEIAGRKSPSYRKDDTLLHIDAFPSSPTNGHRILRFFTNIHPDGKPRVWNVGEPFENVARKFAPSVAGPFLGSSWLLQLLKITKGYRSLYDHYMLQIHNTMKGDAEYQKNVSRTEVRFPPGSSWMVYTDQVSHAALSGQHVLEQTYHLPAGFLQNEQTSPLKVLEKVLNKTLV